MNKYNDFTKFGLSLSIQNCLKKSNYVKPTPIQADAIPPLMEGKDLLGIAQTGS